MSNIEFFHYYRQDVISSCYGARRFFQVGRNDTAFIKMEEVIKSVRKMKDKRRVEYDMIEDFSIVTGVNGEVKKEYRICIFGEKGEIGFFFQMQAPLFIDERAGARASPKGGLERKQI